MTDHGDGRGLKVANRAASKAAASKPRRRSSCERKAARGQGRARRRRLWRRLLEFPPRLVTLNETPRVCRLPSFAHLSAATVLRRPTGPETVKVGLGQLLT